MSQMRPFTNPYPAATGLLAGGTVAPVAPKTPAKTSPMGTYGGGGLGSSETTPSGWDAMTDAEKAAYYGENPTMAAVTRAAQGIFANTVYGRAQNYFDPDFVNRQGLIAMGVDPQAYQAAKENFRQSEIRAMNEAQAQAEAESARQAAQEGFRSSEITAMNDAQAQAQAAAEADIGSYGGGSFAEQQAQQQALQNALAQLSIQQAPMYSAQEAERQAAEAAAEADIGSYGGGSFAEQAAMNDAIAAAAAAEAQSISDQSAANEGGYDTGYGTGDTSGGFGEGQYAKGGKVIKGHLKGPNPKGPDEGYGALLGGEFVIKKSSVKKYGEGLLGMINEGKIPVSKMKSLLG